MSEENFIESLDKEHMETGYKIVELLKENPNRAKLEILGFVLLLGWETISLHHPKDYKEIRKGCKKYFKSLGLLCLETMEDARQTHNKGETNE